MNYIGTAEKGYVMKKIALFNHKGGVGKTTLSINLADAFAEAGKTVLIVDADPQCNLTSFYLEEPVLEKLLGDSNDDSSGQTQRHFSTSWRCIAFRIRRGIAVCLD